MLAFAESPNRIEFYGNSIINAATLADVAEPYQCLSSFFGGFSTVFVVSVGPLHCFLQVHGANISRPLKWDDESTCKREQKSNKMQINTVCTNLKFKWMTNNGLDYFLYSKKQQQAYTVHWNDYVRDSQMNQHEITMRCVSAKLHSFRLNSMQNDGFIRCLLTMSHHHP